MMGAKRSANRATVRHIEGGNVFGADPHKRTVTASVLDERGGVLATASFRVSGNGHRAMEAWALRFGPITRWGIEGASGFGRHTAMYLINQGHDVRDVCPTRTAQQARSRRQGKTDALDSVRIARETQADPDMPVAFKRASGDAGPDETHELMSLWHKARRSILKSRQHLLNEAEQLLGELPEELRDTLPDTPSVRPRLAAVTRPPERDWDPATTLRLRPDLVGSAGVSANRDAVTWCFSYPTSAGSQDGGFGTSRRLELGLSIAQRGFCEKCRGDISTGWAAVHGMLETDEGRRVNEQGKWQIAPLDPSHPRSGRSRRPGHDVTMSGG